MPSSLVQLATSENFQISYEHEAVWLAQKNQANVLIGDFYGDPSVAIIDAEERWCAAGGCGLIAYFLEAPFTPYEYDQSSLQYLEAGRAKQDQWWVESIKQTGPFSICVKLEDGISHDIQFQRTPDGSH